MRTRPLIAELFHILLELSPTPAPLAPRRPRRLSCFHVPSPRLGADPPAPVLPPARYPPHPQVGTNGTSQRPSRPTCVHSVTSYPADIQGVLGDVCWDYFWVFCHPDNMIWKLDDIDINLVEAPKAPGEMMGGVEYTRGGNEVIV